SRSHQEGSDILHCTLLANVVTVRLRCVSPANWMQRCSANAPGTAVSQRVIETVIAPEHFLAHEERRRTEYSLGLRLVGLMAQAQLVGFLLGFVDDFLRPQTQLRKHLAHAARRGATQSPRQAGPRFARCALR